MRGAPGFPGGAEKRGCPSPGSPGRRCPFGWEPCRPAALAPRPALPQGSAPSCRRVCIPAVSLPRTGSVLRQTRFPDTGARTPWRPRRRRRRVWRVGRSEAESPRSGPLRSPRPRRPPVAMTGPQEAETRGPGVPLAGRWEPARLLRSERGGWQVGGAWSPHWTPSPLCRGWGQLRPLLPSSSPPLTPACSSVRRRQPAPLSFLNVALPLCRLRRAHRAGVPRGMARSGSRSVIVWRDVPGPGGAGGPRRARRSGLQLRPQGHGAAQGGQMAFTTGALCPPAFSGPGLGSRRRPVVLG